MYFGITINYNIKIFYIYKLAASKKNLEKFSLIYYLGLIGLLN